MKERQITEPERNFEAEKAALKTDRFHENEAFLCVIQERVTTWFLLKEYFEPCL